MEAYDLDILVLGRQANIRYVTGAPQLWIAGTRPFGPMCVVVRATGENIRNLDVIGLYRIPVVGTRQLNHDPATGRLLVTLGPEANGAKRALFILARRKTDASIVFCFVEEA